MALEIEPEAIEQALQAAGFVRGVTSGWGAGEVVYSRAHTWRPRLDADPVASGLHVKIFTTIDASSGRVRGTGKDAIRAALIYQDGQGKGYGQGKDTRVHRTGDLAVMAAHATHTKGAATKRAIAAGCMLCRMMERARNMWATADAIVRGPLCCKCGAPVYDDSGACVVKACRATGGRYQPRKEAV